jgi:hypothetical protein
MSDRDCDLCSACPSRRTFLTQVSGSLLAGMLAPVLAERCHARAAISDTGK